MPPSSAPAIVLCSGLAADGTIFEPQKLEFSQLEIADWIEPLPREGFENYCRRMAKGVQTNNPVLVGGASFGGIVAMHMAKWIEPAGVVLIGSVRHPTELPLRIRMWRPFWRLVKFLPIQLIQLGGRTASLGFRLLGFRHMAAVAHQAATANPKVLRWSLEQILRWNGPPTLDCPVYHIHGTRDIIMPVRLVAPTKVVDGGGHLLSLSDAREVNEFLIDCAGGEAPEDRQT